MSDPQWGHHSPSDVELDENGTIRRNFLPQSPWETLRKRLVDDSDCNGPRVHWNWIRTTSDGGGDRQNRMECLDSRSLLTWNSGYWDCDLQLEPIAYEIQRILPTAMHTTMSDNGFQGDHSDRWAATSLHSWTHSQLHWQPRPRPSWPPNRPRPGLHNAHDIDLIPRPDKLTCPNCERGDGDDDARRVVSPHLLIGAWEGEVQDWDCYPDWPDPTDAHSPNFGLLS